MAGLIAAAGVLPWVLTAPLNVRFHPELPWAAAATAAWLAIMVLWLAGVAWPRSLSAFRRFHLRLWRPTPGAWSGASLMEILGLVAVMVVLSVIWVVASSGQVPVDVSVYPTTSIRISILVMGAVVSGVVEEVAFRGYMQSHLERFGPVFAITATSVLFVLLHINHGIGYLISVAPGFFIISVLYGLLAMKSGSILPGMAIHITGDAAHTYFGLLNGDASLLFAN